MSHISFHLSIVLTNCVQDPGSSISIHIREPEPNPVKKRSLEFITGASDIGIGTSATGGSVSLSGNSKGKDGKHGKDGKNGKKGDGIANVSLPI